jgi:hypothetical protein
MNRKAPALVGALQQQASEQSLRAQCDALCEAREYCPHVARIGWSQADVPSSPRGRRQTEAPPH